MNKYFLITLTVSSVNWQKELIYQLKLPPTNIISSSTKKYSKVVNDECSETDIDKINMLNENQQMTKRNLPLLISLLKKVSQFKKFLIMCGVSDTSLRLVSDNMRVISIKAGDYIFTKNQIAYCMYGIIQGIVELEEYYELDDIEIDENNYKKFSKIKNTITNANSDNANGNQVNIVLSPIIPGKKLKKINRLKEGNIFGVMNMVFNQPRTETAKAIADVDLLIIDKPNFDMYLRKAFLNAERIKRNYVKSVIPELHQVFPEYKLDEIYKKLKTKVRVSIINNIFAYYYC